jgi:aryl-alcohol dehydrogenase-like predicted oxidoreductase
MTIDRLAVGLAALGRPAYINVGRVGELPARRTVDELRAASWAVLDAAYRAGVRRVDVARSYGRAEEFLAGWLADRGHDDVTVSSKWGYAYVGQWRVDAPVHEVKEHSTARFRTQLAESRALLGDRIALYQVHSLTVDSPLFDQPDLIAALAELGADRTRVGFSTSGPAQADAVRRGLALEVSGRPVFTSVQSTWNPLEQVKEPVANGTLVVSPPAQVSELAARHNTGADAVVLAAALAQPWADVVLLGSASVVQLMDNLAATRVRFGPGELDTLLTVRQSPERYWANRSALPWT